MNTSPTLSILAQRLRELRLQRKAQDGEGWTQERVADRLGVAPNTYAGWERGEIVPRLEPLSAAARLYDVSLDYLVGESKPDSASYTERGITWRLTRLQATTEDERAADVWQRLMRGERSLSIANALGIPSSEIERYANQLVLSECVQIERVPRAPDLEERVRQHFKDAGGNALLREVWIANLSHIELRFARFVVLGHLAKQYFVGMVRSGNGVGLCGGFAVSRMVYSLRSGECPAGIRVFSIAASPIFERAGLSANSMVSALAYRQYGYGITASELPFIPQEVGGQPQSPALRVARRILDDAAAVDYVFMGVGASGKGALAIDISELGLDYLWAAGIRDLDPMHEAVGNVMYHLVDKAGEPLPGFKAQNEQLVCSIGLAGLRRLVDAAKRVVIIASGSHKARITSAAIRAKYANVLIIDDDLAAALLSTHG